MMTRGDNYLGKCPFFTNNVTRGRLIMDFDFDKTSKKPLMKKIIKEVIIWIIELAIVVGLAYFVVNFTIDRTTMLEASMDPTLVDQDKIIINKFAYRFSKPERFDVVVFKQSGNEHSYYNIKRIIGLPGETIYINNGNVYINGDLLNEPIGIEPISNSGLAAEEITLDENEYFVLGDNRNNSEDSRFANIGNILSDEIIGKAWIRTNNFNLVDKLNVKREEK